MLVHFRRMLAPHDCRSCSAQERWVNHEGLLVTAIILGLVLLAWLEQIIIPFFRH